MIFDHPTSKEEAELILEEHLFNPGSKEGAIDELEVIKWYKDFLCEKERFFVNRVLEEWLGSQDLNYVMTANSIIHVCKITSLLEPLKQCLEKFKKQRTKLHRLYYKTLEETIEKISQ